MAQGTRLPRLGFVYDPASFPALVIAQSARGLCELVWLADLRDKRLGATVRLLGRTGTVVDIAGMTPDEAASAVSAQGVDGVLALADDVLEWAAALAELLGCRFMSAETALRVNDKYAQRRALRAAGLATPGSWTVSAALTDAEWNVVQSEASFPAVLKPRHGAASRNTYKVTAIGEARDVVVGAREGDDVEPDWVLEEYIADIDHAVCGVGFANYVSVESVVADGVITHLAVTGRTPPADPFRETGLFVPADIDADLERAIIDTAGRALIALGATVGCFHTEVKMTPAGPVVIEVNGRIGGGIPQLLDLTAGMDIIRLSMRLAIGNNVGVARPELSGVAYYLWMQAPEHLHQLSAVRGLDELRAVPGVREIAQNRRSGDQVDWRDGNNGYIYSVVGMTDGHDGFRDVLRLIVDLVKIEGA